MVVGKASHTKEINQNFRIYANQGIPVHYLETYPEGYRITIERQGVQMISDNHNAYNNYNNYIDEYELTNGYAVVDRNFSIVTANEPMYLFLGMSKHYSIMDAIHQVDH